ncbi:MAG: hypothetical protein KF909_12860 [Rhodocyclaceae bacterium]|nr:hypothetical protein [Rhodocyclaceae bacterium]MCP5241798.1 hypothetical protein [Zoogloeaceae bacterium]MCB1913678.1 hypothetical protein [Rhodocyclaceae bacterium]MCP5252858.1 hypothetical protein [Zoogloeaceae bacterium]MCP5293124.1 hypothetical protein [Zoogloeaceae bacterium]
MNDDFQLPPGYAHLRPDCEQFFRDHPDYDRNVFIMTRFDAGNRLLAQLDEELRRALCREGLNGLRADDRMYPRDRQLWTNVCVYMLCCKYGLAVLEDRIKDEFNPNVALEYGFMRALDKPTLLLADVGFRNLRADIVGTLREPFDIVDMSTSLPSAIANWSRDLGVQVIALPGELHAQALRIHRRLLNIRCAQLLRDEARRRKETNDEFWYLGEEIAAYRVLLQGRPDATHAAAVERTGQRLVDGHDFSVLAEMIETFSELARKAS